MSFLQTSDNFWSNIIKLKKELNGLSYRTYIKYAGRGKWRGGGGGERGVLQIFKKRISNPGDHGPKSQQFLQEIFHGPSHQF